MKVLFAGRPVLFRVFLLSSSTGNQADDFELRQRGVGPHFQMQPVATAGDGKDHAIVPNFRFGLNVDYRFDTQWIDEIDVAARNPIAVSLKQECAPACFNVARHRRLIDSTFDIDVDARFDIRQLILDCNIAAALDVNCQTQAAEKRRSGTRVPLRDESQKFFEAATICEALDLHASFQKRG